jgi:tRNA threonylcarbamoyl adenosine modification protein YeaZ
MGRLTLAFDTATDVATCALLDGATVIGESTGVARALLQDVDALLGQAGAGPEDLRSLVVGIGPGSFTSTRIGLAVARGLGLGLGIPAAGVSTLDALAAARPGVFPVVDARRREVFVRGPRAVAPDDLELEPGTVCIGSGAVRYRAALERMGAEVPPDGNEIHVPHARLHASLAGEPGDTDALEPIYVRAPDAKAGAA